MPLINNNLDMDPATAEPAAAAANRRVEYEPSRRCRRLQSPHPIRRSSLSTNGRELRPRSTLPQRRSSVPCRPVSFVRSVQPRRVSISPQWVQEHHPLAFQVVHCSKNSRHVFISVSPLRHCQCGSGACWNRQLL